MNERAQLDRGALVVGTVAIASRALFAAWAWGRFPPVDDAVYYEKLAARLAGGAGYTWLWPDGVVTYAAHYPVGYPWLLSMVYRVLGPVPSAAMVLNGVLGLLASLAALGVLRRVVGPRAALGGALAVSLEPALFAYLPALMTEGVTAHLLVVGAWLTTVAARSRRVGPLVALGLVVGVATLVRPQSLLFALPFGWLATRGRASARALRVAGVLGVAIAVCLPWTARNCVRMKRCALVSVNGGWNLLIGASPEATGRWAPVPVPDECRSVFDEAEKDACFGRAARRIIAASPVHFLSLVPRKLSYTFDYAGAAPYYLHASAPASFGDAAKTALGGVESIFHRLATMLAAVALYAAATRRRPVALGLALVTIVASSAVLVTGSERGAWVGHLALAASALLVGRSTLAALTGWVLVVTALTHAVFFGAGRYGLVTFPFVTMLAATLSRSASPRSLDGTALAGSDP